MIPFNFFKPRLNCESDVNNSGHKTSDYPHMLSGSGILDLYETEMKLINIIVTIPFMKLSMKLTMEMKPAAAKKVSVLL